MRPTVEKASTAPLSVMFSFQPTVLERRVLPASSLKDLSITQASLQPLQASALSLLTQNLIKQNLSILLVADLLSYYILI